jgi:hypothetical protein
MPTYTIKNTEDDSVSEHIMSYSKLQDYLSENPHMRHIMGTPLLHSGRGMGKPDDSFNDKLKALKKAHRGSTIHTY